MAVIWAIGEVVDGAPTRLTLELATLAHGLAAAGGGDATTLLIGADASRAAAVTAATGTAVLVVEAAEVDQPAAAALAAEVVPLIAERSPDWILIGATPDGKDLAGALVGLTDLPILVNSSGVSWGDGPVVEMSTFGGRMVTRSGFTGARGIILVRPAIVSAEVADTPGPIGTANATRPAVLPAVRVIDHGTQATTAASIEEARTIVGAGRGVGGPDGLGIIEELADALGGAVGATRAVVDAGWIGYGQQIGQTGKIVKPDLYVACGVSGAIQHKVGVQTAGTIVAINRDPDAPIVEFADLVVVGDLFEVVPRLSAAIRAHRAEG